MCHLMRQQQQVVPPQTNETAEKKSTQNQKVKISIDIFFTLPTYFDDSYS